MHDGLEFSPMFCGGYCEEKSTMNNLDAQCVLADYVRQKEEPCE